MKYNLLLLKKVSDVQEELLINSYSNIFSNLCEIGLQKEYDLDSIYKRYMGFVYSNINKSDSHFAIELESILPLFSYLQHSQGGRGIFIEKLFSLLNKDVSRDFRLRYFPLIFLDFEKYRKTKLFDKVHNSYDKSKLWGWEGTKKDDVVFDLCKYGRNKIIFCDLKNRVDSGGTSARRESIGKIQNVLKLLNESKRLFVNKENNLKYSLLNYLAENYISELRISFGILYNVDSSPGTQIGDKNQGFLGESKKQMSYIFDYLSIHDVFSNVKFDEHNLKLYATFSRDNINLNIQISCDYGNDIINLFMDGESKIKTLYDFENKINLYDDIWLCLKINIKERELLIKYNENLIQIFTNYFLTKSKLELSSYLDKIFKHSHEFFNLIYLDNKTKIDKLFRDNMGQEYIYDVMLIAYIYCYIK